MHDILLRVNAFLNEVNAGGAKVPSELAEVFAENAKATWEKRFIQNEPRKFTLRPSNLGRPHCQLMAERDGVPAEPQSADFTMKMYIGDLIEAAAHVILQAAGVNIEAKSKQVSGDIFGYKINGELDLIIDGKIYDVKSVSKWVFEHKCTSIEAFIGDGDAFGYLGQSFIYSVLEGKPFGGWIVICKEDGRWGLVDVPEEKYSDYHVEAMKIVKANLDMSDKPFSRAFDDEVETFRKVATGNRVLGWTCSMCPRKWGPKCWPKLKMLPSLPSAAMNKQMVYYTHIDPKWLNDDAVPTSTTSGQ